MHTIVEFERTNFVTFPPIELDAKLIQGRAQFTLMRDSCPISNETLDPFWDLLHF
jgi:hypothetical protein